VKEAVMNEMALAKMKDHAKHGCGIAKPLLAVNDLLDALRQNAAVAESMEYTHAVSLRNLIGGVECLLDAVALLHVDADAKVSLLLTQADAMDQAIRYLAAAVDRLADAGGRLPGPLGSGDPRIN